MKKLFQRKSRANSECSSDIRVFDRRLSLPSEQDIQVLHLFGAPARPTDGGSAISPTLSPEISPNNENGGGHNSNSELTTVQSAALSETETLAYTRQQRFDLQECYQDNFTSYLPFLIRRLRIERQRHQQQMNGNTQHEVEPMDFDDSDEETVASVTDSPYTPIMTRPIEQYNYKRTMIVVTEFIKHSTYVFADAESFKLFKQLRSINKKMRKNSLIVYDTNSNDIKRVRGRASFSEGDKHNDDTVVDTRQHIIPLEYKLQGRGLPFFKIVVPYMSSFRKNVPHMIFRKYREVPHKPSMPASDEQENFETYDFCTVYVKTFQQFKRYTLHFAPADQPLFKMLVFQNNFRPFTDFKYRDTRFRVLGSSTATPFIVNYNPELKLFILDQNQPSLVDKLVNKSAGLDLRAIVKRRGSVTDDTSGQMQSGSSNELVNPVPDPNSEVLQDNDAGFIRVVKQNYIPGDMPPFGRFLDSCVYSSDSLILPKKYSEAGRIELYQNPAEIAHLDFSSTLAVDLDLLVLSTIMLILRESNLRSSNRYSSASLVGRLGPLPGPGVAVFSTTDAGWPFSVN